MSHRPRSPRGLDRRLFLTGLAAVPAGTGLIRSLGRAAAVTPPDTGREIPSSGTVIDGAAVAGLVGVSVSWSRGPVRGAVRIRHRRAGRWSTWEELDADVHGPPDPTGRSHSPPVLVPGADAYEVVPATGTRSARLHPLSDDEGRLRLAALTVDTPVPGLDIIRRENWTTEPREPTWDCVLGSSLFGAGCRADVGLRHALVHHTVNVNTYAPGDVPALLRGIRRYHVGTRGWDDIAYNFVVDRFGRIWHARDGDIAEPITGGHTTGLNTESVGVAVLGTFTTTDPGDAVVDALGRLLGWKLSLHGVDPLGATVVRSSGGDYAAPGDMIWVRNIAGHRDHQITSCPGSALYRRLDEVRLVAAGAVPVFGHVRPRYHPDRVDIEGWAQDRSDLTRAVRITVDVDGVVTELVADTTAPSLVDDYLEARGTHGFVHTVPIDLDTRSIVVTAHAADGRTAELMDLHLFATFIDVEPDRFYAPGIRWLRAHELTTGTLPGLFEPRDVLTRAQMAVFLWRLMDRPDAGVTADFDDVDRPSWYAAAVDWLAEVGVTTGTSPTTFSPERAVTRKQMAAFLWRLVGSPPATTTAPFVDVDRPSWWAPAVDWLAEVGVTTGTSPTTFSPERAVTRGEMAVFLHRLASTPDAWTRVAAPPVVEATLAGA